MSGCLCHTVVSFLKSKDAEFTQNLTPVGFGPSSNTCPKWALQSAHLTSTRRSPIKYTGDKLEEITLFGHVLLREH